MNPFFNFAYAACAMGRVIAILDTISLSPGGMAGGLSGDTAAVSSDRVNWGHENSHRLDIVHLERQAARTVTIQRSRTGATGNREGTAGGESPFQPLEYGSWALDYRGDGRTLASGTVYLLPYYMGLYHGYIE